MKISVIITTKNEEKNLNRLLESLKRQSFKDFEIIVVDNHSKDETSTIARKFTTEVYTYGPERSSQRNLGLKKAKGNYILFVDADMELQNKVLEECLKVINAKPETKGIIIDEISKGKTFLSRVKQLEKELLVNSPEIEAPRFFAKMDLLKVGGYDEKLISGEDWDLSIRLKKLGKFSKIKSKIIHHENKSLVEDIKKKYYYALHIKKYAAKNPEYFSSQSSIKYRLKILFRRPKIILKKPSEFSALIILKFFHALAYYIAFLKN